MMTISGQRISTKGRIAPALVNPAAGESILKPRFRRDELSPADKSAAPCCCGICCLCSLIHFIREQPSKLPFPWGSGPPPHLKDGSLGTPEFHTQTASRLVHPFW